MIGLSETMSCPKCNSQSVSPLHFITTSNYFAEHREILYTKMEQFIPNFKRLAKKRQFDILVQGYEIKNDDLIFINTKIMIFTQEFIYNSKRFLEPNI